MARKWSCGISAAVLLVLAAVPAAAQDHAALWAAVAQPAFDAQKTAAVSNLVIERDRIKLTLVSGTLSFAQPVGGSVFAAVFTGQGRIEAVPPNALEAHQLRVNAGQASLSMDFSEAVLSFTDDTFAELGAKLTFTPGAVAEASEIYRKRSSDREDSAAEIVPRVFKGLLAQNRKQAAFFAADVKTRDKGWVLARFDALEPEEVRIGRWQNHGFATLLDVWMQFPASGRSAAEAFHDPLARDDYQLRSYVITATVNGDAELQAITRVQLTQQLAGERVLLFEFDSNLRLEFVKDEKGGALPFFQPRDPVRREQSYGDYVAVVLPTPTVAHQAQTLEFKYAGKRVVRKEGSGNYFCQSYGWYPTRPSSFVSRSDFDLTFKSPRKYTLVATGNKISETTDGDWVITQWKSDIPLAVAGFAFGDYKITTEKVGEIAVEIYANRQADDIMRGIQSVLDPTLPQQIGSGSLAGSAAGTLNAATLARPMATEIANTLRVFENYFGPYPYKRLAVSSLPLGYSYGQGWPMLIYLWSLSFLDAQQRHTLGIRDHAQLTDFFRAHESSHQWWGHRVSWKSYHDQWLSEGFAEFSGNLYVQFKRGEKEFVARLRRDRQELLALGDTKNRRMEALGPIWMGARLSTLEAPRAYSFLVYTKGGYVLNMIRMMLYNPRSQNPEERFITMMREFTQTYHNRAASTEDFKALVEKYITPAMDVDRNQKMDWFFNQYVYGTGIAEYNFRYNIEAAPDNKWKVTGTLLRSGVPDTWKDALPLYVVQGGRTVRFGWLTSRGPVENFEFPLLPFKPEKFILNANEDILAEVKQ